MIIVKLETKHRKIDFWWHRGKRVTYNTASESDPSAAAASRRAEFLGMPRRRRFFMAQPNPTRIFQTFQPAEYFSAQIRREHTA